MTVGETLASPHEDHDGRSTNTVTFLITLSFHVELIKQLRPSQLWQNLVFLRHSHGWLRHQDF